MSAKRAADQGELQHCRCCTRRWLLTRDQGIVEGRWWVEMLKIKYIFLLPWWLFRIHSSVTWQPESHVTCAATLISAGFFFFCKNKVPMVIYSKIFFILCTFLPSSLSLLIFKGFRSEDTLTTGWFLVYEICLHFRYLSVTGFHSQAVVPETDWWGSSLRPDLKLVVRPHQTASQDHHQRGESFFQSVTTLGIRWKTLLVWSYINPAGSWLQGKLLLLAYLPFLEHLRIS